jgi:hypothetical protein
VVQQRHWVELWAVASQEGQLDALGLPPNPGADQLGPGHQMAVHDQVHLSALAIAEPSAQQVDAHRPGERPGDQADRSRPWLAMALIMLTESACQSAC